MTKPLFIDSLEAAVDHVLDTLKGDIVLGIPLGVGKPNVFVNALYERVKNNPARKLRIITALSLEKPVGHSDLERHFLQPLVERVFADYPDLQYVKDLQRRRHAAAQHRGARVLHEDRRLPGQRSRAAGATSPPTTPSWRATWRCRAMNVIAQAVAAQGEGDGAAAVAVEQPRRRVRGGGERAAENRQPLLIKVGVVNQQMPFMPNGAEVSPDFFDLLVTDPAATHTVFGPPNNKVSAADYAIGLHASSLVVDGGTLQIGIGSLGDAIAQALIVRDRHGDEYQRMLQSLAGPDLSGRETGRFDQGLYGCSEMFVNGFLR
jgi:acyl-CoA hydrolase